MLRLFTLLFVIVIIIYVIEGSALNNGIDRLCKPVNCRGKIKKCPYGYQKKDGCEICKCYDPCNPPGKAFLCGSNKRCFIDKKPNGTFVARCGFKQSKRSKDACEQEKIVGLCKAAFPRFYYNSVTKDCEQFIYGGCGGNNNNFVTKTECEITCVA